MPFSCLNSCRICNIETAVQISSFLSLHLVPILLRVWKILLLYMRGREEFTRINWLENCILFQIQSNMQHLHFAWLQYSPILSISLFWSCFFSFSIFLLFVPSSFLTPVSSSLNLLIVCAKRFSFSLFKYFGFHALYPYRFPCPSRPFYSVFLAALAPFRIPWPSSPITPSLVRLFSRCTSWFSCPSCSSRSSFRLFCSSSSYNRSSFNPLSFSLFSSISPLVPLSVLLLFVFTQRIPSNYNLNNLQIQ